MDGQQSPEESVYGTPDCTLTPEDDSEEEVEELEPEDLNSNHLQHKQGGDGVVSSSSPSKGLANGAEGEADPLGGDDGSQEEAAGESSLPKTVTRLEAPGGALVYLVGTAHFSKESQEDVARTIRSVRPDVVVVELCKGRVNILQLDEQTILQEARSLNFNKVRLTLRHNGLVQGVLHLLLLSMSAHLTKELGMAPGGEFRRAFAEARRIPGCAVQLGDRPYQITLRRALAALSCWQKVRLAWHILASRESISREDVERCKQRDLLEEMLAEMTGEFPAVSRVFVKERDLYLTHSLQAAAAAAPLLSHSPSSGADLEELEAQLVGCECPAGSNCLDSTSCSCTGLFGVPYSSERRLTQEGKSFPVVECHENCKCGDKCGMRVVQKGPHSGLQIRSSGMKGLGLYTLRDIPRGTFVCEYAGEVISVEEAQLRERAAPPGSPNYILVLRESGNVSVVVDPTYVGNVGRYANHSCCPNMEVVAVRVGCPVPCIALFTTKDVQMGEELTFHYGGGSSGEHSYGLEERRCKCGEKSCCGKLPFDPTIF